MIRYSKDSPDGTILKGFIAPIGYSQRHWLPRFMLALQSKLPEILPPALQTFGRLHGSESNRWFTVFSSQPIAMQ
jgi:hypothetical protein